MSGRSKNHTLKGGTSPYSLSMGVPPRDTASDRQRLYGNTFQRSVRAIVSDRQRLYGNTFQRSSDHQRSSVTSIWHRPVQKMPVKCQNLLQKSPKVAEKLLVFAKSYSKLLIFVKLAQKLLLLKL